MAALQHGLVSSSTTSLAAIQNAAPNCHCLEGACGPAQCSMAFQPIVDTRTSRIVAYEALARGLHGEPASTVLEDALGDNRHRLDQRRRIRAIEIASTLGIGATGADLCINFFPNAVYEASACLQHTIRAAELAFLSPQRLIFEINEMEQVVHLDHLHRIVLEYRDAGIRTAMDDFGSGFAGLSLLAAFQPDIVKIDIALTRNIHQRRASQTIVRAIVEICTDLGIEMIAEGVELREEMEALQALGIFHLQGFYLAAPAFECLPELETYSEVRLKHAAAMASGSPGAEPVRQRKLLAQFGRPQVLADMGQSEF